MSQAIVLAFLERLAEDRRKGSERPLAAYQEMYPGFEALLAEAYVQALAEGNGTHAVRRRAEPGADGERLGPYRILAELGRGGQGIVYRAQDERVGRTVALKVLTALGPGSSDARRRFQREAAIASRLSHAHIRTVYEADLEDGVPYIAMEFVDGASLAQRIEEARGRPVSQGSRWLRLDEPRAELTAILVLFEKVARALHHAHEAGVVHRDVKPANVLVTAKGEPVLSDFGLAGATAPEQLALTLTGDVLGTPAYMSPEQLSLGGTHLDRRTDVYSLGASLYECLTLAPPFQAATREALHQLVLTRDPVRPRRLNPTVPRELEVVVEVAMEKDRDRRYQTAEALADDLRRVRLHEPILARPAGPVLRLVRWSQRNPVLAAATLVTGVLLAGIAGVYAWKNREVNARNEELVTRGQELETALDQVREEAARTLREKERVTRLKDRRTLRLLLERADGLYPPLPERIEAMEAWLGDAERLAASLPLHREALAAMESRRAAASSSPAEPADEEEAWIHELLVELVGELETFEGPQGRVADVRGRLTRAREIGPRTLDAHRADWSAAIERVRADPRFGGLALVPQVGLVPLGPDPDSGLEEFLHWLTQDPDAPLPTRDAEGRLPAVGNGTGILLALLPGGTFLQGCTTDPAGPNFDPIPREREGPVHPVTLDPFFLAKHELTRGQWQRISGQTDPSHFDRATAWRMKETDFRRYPVESVSWIQCREELSRAGLVLPTESRWEYACRAGTDTPWSFGSDSREFVHYANLADETYAQFWGGKLPYEQGYDDGFGAVAPVGSYRPNAFGLFDLHGNVEEWCADVHGSYLGGHAPGDGLLLEPDDIEGRILRGGCFDTNRIGARTASRGWLQEDRSRSPVGVRAARELTR